MCSSDLIAVHLSILVGKDPQAKKLPSEIVRILDGVGPGDSQKNKQARPYRPCSTIIHGNAGFSYTLNYQSHVSSY